MSAFSFNTTYQPTGDQQKDAIAQIDIMQNRAVQANLAYQSSLDAETLMKQLGQINDELGALLDSVENHTPVNLGFSLPAFGKTAQGTAKKDEKQVNGAFYHVHWYKYPLTYWLNIITSLGCLEGGDLDIAYLSEIDPTWTDSSLTTILNPEAVIFANPIAQGACAADAIASAFNMPLDVLFWCAGSQGSMYPFNGWVSNESSPLQSSLLVSERMAFKLHRQGMIMETIGKNNAVCNEYPSPILPKERWRYQMVNMYPDSGQCHPFGRSVTRWETGKNPPNTKKNFGYLMWRKRNCVFL